MCTDALSQGQSQEKLQPRRFDIHGVTAKACPASLSPALTTIPALTPAKPSRAAHGLMRGFTAGGTTEYRNDTTRSRDGEEMEGGFRDFTEELVQGIALAERYGKCIGSVQESIEKPTAPGSCCHVDTSSAAQEGPVVQGFADGNVAVIGHDSEETILSSNQEDEEKDLCSTSQVGDGPDAPQRIGHGFGESGRDGAQVEEGEVEQEEVHGGVEAVVAGYGCDDEAIAQEGSQVDAQEEPEVQELQLPCVCECQEEELIDGAAIGHLPVLGMETAKGDKTEKFREASLSKSCFTNCEIPKGAFLSWGTVVHLRGFSSGLWWLSVLCRAVPSTHGLLKGQPCFTAMTHGGSNTQCVWREGSWGGDPWAAL
ncbi:hypothetical protein QYF61_023731 [Mycteria americana]|uniref:Uncharacterized protein n=1 Tax=Mycteria americana TaxID=33587 RepID=A0AAN7MC81_MYCAM|nr:hypothetical protein QYF61_023731 [Mycteria americana]